MSGLMAWIRSHVAIVVLSAVIVVSIPTAFAVSTAWNRSIRTSRQSEVETDYKKLEARVTYVLPPIQPGEEAVTYPAEAPNESITRWFRDRRAERDAQVKGVINAATEINREGHDLMVEGLLPEPAEVSAYEKRLEFMERLVGKGGEPSAYQKLLDAIHAGPPYDAEAVAEEIQSMIQTELERARAERTGSGDVTLTREQAEALAKRVVDYRLGRYEQRAGEISVYATLDCLPPEEVIPREVPRSEADYPTWRCFELQWDFWLIADLLRAVAAANTDADGHPLPVDRSVVKRIERIRFDELPIIGDRELRREEWTPTPGLGSDKAPLDPNVSITGRRSSKHNSLYDVRRAELELVVDSARLVDLVSAISRTNFMTVIGCDLSEVDVVKDLQQGYFYGPAHVIRAKLVIESVWLRSWIEPLMPPSIKRAFGIAAGAVEEAPASAPAPAPTPTRRRNVLEDDEDRPRRGRGGGG